MLFCDLILQALLIITTFVALAATICWWVAFQKALYLVKMMDLNDTLLFLDPASIISCEKVDRFENIHSQRPTYQRVLHGETGFH